MTPDIDAWEAWTPSQVAERLAGVPVPWYVAGGWAIDLHLGGGLRRRPRPGAPGARVAVITLS